MNNLQNMVQRMKMALDSRTVSTENCHQKNLQNLNKCEMCRDTGWILQENGKYKECRCSTERNNINALRIAGLQDSDIDKTFKNFDAWNEDAREMKNTATNYYLNFDKVHKNKCNSLALLGQSGAGKTHLLLALINSFIKKKSLNIRYMSYIDSITFLKQNIINGEVYQNKINSYKNAEILVIDDLFKGGYKETDIRIMMEIINHRYVNCLATMISSEMFLNDLVKIDSALGGRIKEMTESYLYQVNGQERNYRLR